MPHKYPERRVNKKPVPALGALALLPRALHILSAFSHMPCRWAPAPFSEDLDRARSGSSLPSRPILSASKTGLYPPGDLGGAPSKVPVLCPYPPRARLWAQCPVWMNENTSPGRGVAWVMVPGWSLSPGFRQSSEQTTHSRPSHPRPYLSPAGQCWTGST